MSISVSTLDNSVQLRLRNTVGSQISQSTRLEAMNRVIDYLQSKANWNATRRIQPFSFLEKETEYSVANDIGISDMKQVEDIRFATEEQQVKEFEEIDSADFSIFERQSNYNNTYSLEERDTAQILRILASRGNGVTTIDELDDLTTGRTWASDTSTSDATTLAQDTTKAKVGNSLRCNITTTQSANNRAAIYTSTSFSTAFDLTDYVNVGVFRLWLGLHAMSAANLSRISGVTFVWGSDSSVTPATKANYYSLQTTTPLLGGSFKAGWNRMSFPWSSSSVSTTGSPTDTAIKYFEIQLDYSSALTNTNNIRFDQIKLFQPAEAELVYFSTHMVSLSGVLQAGFTTSSINTGESLILPQRCMDMFVDLTLLELFPQKEKKNDDYLRILPRAKELLALAILQDGNALTREVERFQVDGNSSGRADTTNSQW